MGKNKIIDEILDRVVEIEALIDDWPEDEFFMAREHLDQLQEEIKSLRDDE